MGIFGKKFGRNKTPDISQELLALKSKISELSRKYPTGASSFGAGAGQAQEQIPIICRNIDEAVRALKTGIDPNNHPITKPQIADGLKRLVNATKNPAFAGLMAAVLNPAGVSELEKYLSELEQIASKIK